MKYGVACLFLIVAVIGFTHAEEEKCKPGTMKQEDCNTCVCSSTGEYICTAMGCLEKRHARECQPGETKQQDCNTCTCTSTGQFACTRKLCLNKRSAEKCQPGEVKQEDCNSCTCTSTGVFACTRKLCLNKRDAPECEDGETKLDDCNTCTCFKGVFGCTRKLCVSKKEAISAKYNTQLSREKRDVPLFADLETTPCAPNDYFQIDCNTCYCNIDRTGYLCTENICHDTNFDMSTTSRIPLTNDSMLIISNQGVQLLKNLNSNDNSISRIAKSSTDSEDSTRNLQKKRLVTPIGYILQPDGCKLCKCGKDSSITCSTPIYYCPRI